MSIFLELTEVNYAMIDGNFTIRFEQPKRKGVMISVGAYSSGSYPYHTINVIVEVFHNNILIKTFSESRKLVTTNSICCVFAEITTKLVSEAVSETTFFRRQSVESFRVSIYLTSDRLTNFSHIQISDMVHYDFTALKNRMGWYKEENIDSETLEGLQELLFSINSIAEGEYHEYVS